MRVCGDNLADLKGGLPSDQAERLHPGCETWAVERAETGPGCMTIWPDTAVGAVSWGGDSFWGSWDVREQVLVLDDEISGHQPVVDASGRLWVLLSAEDFRGWLQGRFPAGEGLETLRQLVDGADPAAFSLQVGCSRLPVYRGREMARAFLEAEESRDRQDSPTHH